MSLTAGDLQQIRAIMREEIAPVEGEVVALRNDIIDIYAALRRVLKVLKLPLL